MEIDGHFQNGIIVPHESPPLPDGTEVTIIVRPGQSATGDKMSDEERKRYLAALARIDSVGNENPGDTFSGADHDRVLYSNAP